MGPVPLAVEEYLQEMPLFYYLFLMRTESHSVTFMLLPLHHLIKVLTVITTYYLKIVANKPFLKKHVPHPPLPN